MNKKIVLSIALLLVLGGAVTALAVEATTPEVTTATIANTVEAVKNLPEPLMLQAEPNGKVLLRGTVVSVSASLMTVKSWGGTWTVNISSATKLTPAILNNDIATQFKEGDFVGVRGTFSSTASWTIDATLVGNRYKTPEQKNKPENQEKKEDKPKLQNQNVQEIQQQIQNILEQIRKLQSQVNNKSYTP